MATTRPKESNTIGKEKKALSSNAHPITKKTTKPSTTTTTASPSDKKAISTDKQVPNYLKPTISSRIESRSQSIFKAKINDASQKPAAVNRRRSLDKPPSPSKLPKENQPSSRLHKALVSPGRPRQRLVSASIRASSSLPVKSPVTSPKPISDKTSKKFRDVKTQPFLAKGSVKRGSSATVTKKASVCLTNNKAPKSDENAEAVNVELPERDINEDSNEEEVVKVEDDVHEHEKLAVAEDHANAADDHDIGETDHQHQPAIDEAEDEKVIPTVEEVEKEHLQEEKPDIEHEEDENNTDYNVNESINDEIENQADDGHAVTEEEPAVNEQKEGEEENNEGTEHLEEEEKQKEESHEEVDDLKEKAVEAEESNKNNEPEAPLNEAVKKESAAAQVSNDVIEETASKLLETRKNKVRALAGAFQTVIDYQAK